MASAVVLPESNSVVLEDTDEALLPAARLEAGEEIVDLPAATEEPGKTKPAPAAAAAPAKPAAPAAAAEDDDLPAELKGKSPKELAKMYREAQSLIGRQGSELGELRRRTDTAIQTSLAALAKAREGAAAAPAAKVEPEVVDEAEFFRAPQAAIAKAIEQSPIIKQIRETLGKSAETAAIDRATAATERFNAAHPDAGTIMQDPEFRQWVGASRVRQALLQRAHQHFDFDAGDEVFGTWKALKGVKAAPAPTVPAAGAEDAAAAATAAASEAAKVLSAAAKRKRDLAAGTVPSGNGGAAPAGGAKKIFRRADVLKLMEDDNERYQALAPEIEKAYREGRVR